MKKIKFTNTIRFKITGAMILCSFIMAILISSIAIFAHYNLLKKEVTEKLTILPQNYSNYFNSDFKGIESCVNTLHHYVASTFNLEKMNTDSNDYVEEYEKMMDTIIKKIAEEANGMQGVRTINGIQAIYFTINPQLTGDAHEIWYADSEGNGNLKKIDADPNGDYIEWFYPNNKQMGWYYNPIKKRKGSWSDPYEEIDLNINIISYTEPVFKDNRLIGVVGIDMNIQAMENTLQNMKIYDTGYAFLMNEQYDLLIVPPLKIEDNLRTKEDGKSKFLIEEREQKDSGIMKYNFDGKVKILGYSRLCNDWILAFVVPKSEVYASLKIYVFFIGIIILISVCIIMIIALFLGKTISKPIVKITQLIHNTAGFNFIDDHSLKLLTNNKDEIGIMSREMLNMRKILKETGVHKGAILQMQSLQRTFPLPNKVNMETLHFPAKTVSGDYYHMEEINNNMVVGIIYDVSGKGVSAALNTSAFNVLFHESVATYQNPVDILSNLNVKVAEFFGEMYVAACCFSFDFQNNTAKIAGAGINQFLYSDNVKYYQEKIVRGPFLGMFEDSLFDEQIIHFKSGDRFYFFTDGLDFIFDDDKVKKDCFMINSITQFKKCLNNLINDRLTDIEGIKDDCTLVALEIK